MSEPVIAVRELNLVLADICETCREKLLDRLHVKPKLASESNVQLDTLLAEICAKHGISEVRLRSGPRSRSIVGIRRRFCKAAKRRGYSLPEIGRFLGMHHTSILYLVHS